MSEEPETQNLPVRPEELLMKKALYRHLFTTKTFVRVAFTTLSLHSMGTAVGQGLPAGTAAPAYGTTWAATQAQPYSLDARNLVSEPKATRKADVRTAESNVPVSPRRTD
jgi:hypothetical protein